MTFKTNSFLPLKDASKICHICMTPSAFSSTQNFIKICHKKLFHTTTSLTDKNYYSILEITPKATKNQIKSSYYKLSLKYHPDQNKQDDAASAKFHQITEAYDVLGDVYKRRLYDKGVLGLSSPFSADESETFSKTVRGTRSGKASSSIATGRTPIYNFDEWSKNHYEATLGRKRQAKFDYDRMMSRKNSKKSDGAIEFTLVIVIFMAISFTIVRTSIDDEKNGKR